MKWVRHLGTFAQYALGIVLFLIVFAIVGPLLFPD